MISFQGILVFCFVDFKPQRYGDYVYPVEATTVGFLIAAASIAMVPIVAVYKILQLKGPIREVNSLTKPLWP